ncbi:MAG: exodeoxyribonuclease VII small subunit [Nitrospiraceae bacterium]|nr:MAG: exodeoxyribonuclease VII small subunit [Nitrospiraceae bacterium]
MSKTKQLTYSQALTELEEILNEIESEEINVDLLAEKVKRASYLIKFCKGKLRNTEEEVKKVLSEIQGTTESDQEDLK